MPNFTTLDEIRDIHPIASQYLHNKGYVNIQHHVKMPITGIADFLAINPDGKTVIVECKIDVCFLKKAVRQLTSYRDQYDRYAEIAVAIPSTGIKDIHRQWCNKHHIILIELNVKTVKFSSPETEASHDSSVNEPSKIGAFILQMGLTQLRDDAQRPDDPNSFTNYLKTHATGEILNTILALIPFSTIDLPTQNRIVSELDNEE